MKKCPYCAEEIQDEAIVCRYCSRELNLQSIPKFKKSNFILFFVGLILLIIQISPVWPSEDDAFFEVAGFTDRLGLTVYLFGAGYYMTDAEIDEQRAKNTEIWGIADTIYNSVRTINSIFCLLVVALIAYSLIRTKSGKSVPKPLIWYISGSILLVYPLVNLLIYWGLFIMPGPIAGSFSAIFLLYYGFSQ